MNLHYGFADNESAMAFVDKFNEAIDQQYYIESESEWQAQYDDDTYEDYVSECEEEDKSKPIVTVIDNTSVRIEITPTSHNMIILASLLSDNFHTV